MLTKINEAFHVYQQGMMEDVNRIIGKSMAGPCEKCSKAIAQLQSHESFNANKPTKLMVEEDDSFIFGIDHTTRLSEHNGMPMITSHDTCEDCLTNFYYEFQGFDSNQIYRYQPNQLKTIKEYKALLANQKILHLQKFAPFLTDYFRDQSGDVTLYISLDEELKRKNHEYLISYYTKENKPLSELDYVRTFLSESELYTAGRIGRLYEKEFLQKITYPLTHIKFDRSDDASPFYNQIV